MYVQLNINLLFLSIDLTVKYIFLIGIIPLDGCIIERVVGVEPIMSILSPSMTGKKGEVKKKPLYFLAEVRYYVCITFYFLLSILN